jgi:hypothetical protein
MVLIGAGFIEHAAKLGPGGDFDGGTGDGKTIISVDHSVHCFFVNSGRKESIGGCLLRMRSREGRCLVDRQTSLLCLTSRFLLQEFSPLSAKK